MDVYGLCLGGNVFGWTADRDDSFAVLDAYVEAGGNFIDTADSYMRPNMGISETIIGEWMAARGNRDALVIATKVGRTVASRRRTSPPQEESLARLQTDRIDLYYAHKDVGDVPVEETVRAFDETVRDGKVVAVAASTFRRTGCVESLALSAREGLAAVRVAAAALQPRSSVRATSATTRRSWSGTGRPWRPTTRWRPAS